MRYLSGATIVNACREHASDLSRLKDELAYSMNAGSGEIADVVARGYLTECLIKTGLSLLGANAVQTKYGSHLRKWFLFQDEYITRPSSGALYTGLDIRQMPKNRSFTRPVCIVEENIERPVGIYVRTGSFANANHRRPPERSVERFTDVFNRIDHEIVFFLPNDYLYSSVAENLREKRVGVGSLDFSSVEFREVLERRVARSV